MQAPNKDAHTAIAFLTARCVGTARVPPPAHNNNNSNAASRQNTQHPSLAAVALDTMPLRPRLEWQLSGLVDMLETVVREGCTLSALVMGPKASGKSLLVERAVARVCAAHNDTTKGDKAVGVVRLSGLMHLEDRVAFSEAARQLCSEFNQSYSQTASYEENLNFFRTMLRSLSTNLKKVIFIVDDFERFAKQRGKQTLLYNLLDELQHSDVQAGLVGITCAQDVMDLMEKRVKSRFSHRRILVSAPLHFEVPDPSTAAPLNRAAASRALQSEEPPMQFQDTPLGMLQDMLSLPVNQQQTGTGRSKAGREAAAGSSACADANANANANVDVHASALPVYSDSSFVARHNEAVTASLQDSRFRAVLYPMFIKSLSPSNLAAIARVALSEWDRELRQQAQQSQQGQPQQQSQQQQPQQQQQQQQQDSRQQDAPDASPSNARKRARATQQTGPDSPSRRLRTTAHTNASDQAQQQLVLLQPRHLLVGCNTLMAADSLVPLVCDLSVLQLYLLAGMVRLSVKKHSSYNFEMVWDECKSIQNSSGILGTFKHSPKCAWRAFEGLLATGLAFHVDQGAEAKGRTMKYQGVTLRLTGTEVDEGLGAHASCPDELRRFLRMES